MKPHGLVCLTVGVLFVLGWFSPVWAFHTWKREHLPNGLTLLVVEKPGASAVSLTLLVKRGATSEPSEKRGVGSLTAHLLTAGTRHRSGDQIAERIATLGGEFAQDVSFDFTTIDWAVLKADLPQALEVLADVVQYPVFPPAELEHERTARIAEQQAKREDAPEDVPTRHWFGTGPYGLPIAGEAVSLQRIVREDVIRFHRQAYRPDATILAAAGDLTLEDLTARVRKYFGSWSASDQREKEFPSLSVKKESAVRVVNRPLVQASVRLAFLGAPAASPDAPALLLLSQLLAGSGESRLGQKLREQKGWTYGVRSAVDSFRQTGVFSIEMSVPYEVVLPAIEETFGEITRIQTVPVSAAELERAKQELTDSVYFKTEKIQDLSRFVAIQAAYTQDQESPERTLVALRRVTAEEMQRVAHTYLDPQGMVMTVVGDAQALGKYASPLVQGKLPQWPSGARTQQGERDLLPQDQSAPRER